MKKNYFAAKTAIIEKGARIGKGTKIWDFSHITKTAIIGNNCNIGQNCYIAGTVGNGCKIQNNVNIYLGVILKDWVFCGPSMTFTNDMNPRSKYPKTTNEYKKTIVEEGVTIGANTTIVCDIKIGEWAFIGAGSVVTKDIPPFTLVYGNPAKVMGRVDKRGNKIKNSKVKNQNCSSKIKI